MKAIRARWLSVIPGRAAAACLAAALLTSAAGAAEPMPGVLPVRADLATATLSPTSIYLRTCEIDTTRTPADTRAAAAPKLDAGKWYLLQLDGPITPQRRQALREAGIRLAEYMQVNTFLATGDNAALRPGAAQGVNFVRFFTAYRPDWKLDPELGVRNYATPERQFQAAQGRVSAVITLHQGEALQPVLNQIAALGDAAIDYTDEIAGNITVAVTMGKDKAAKLAQLDAVEFIEDASENTLRSNYADRWICQSNVSGVFPIYNAGITGTGQVLGHCDGSINIGHCSFQDTVNPVGPLHRKVISLNGTSGYDQHGTHTAATAVGYAPAQPNTSDVNGQATGAKLVHSGIPSQTTGTGLNNILTLHYSQGARVHTNSWGDDGTTAYTDQCRVIDAHTYTNEDSLVCFAVSNLSTVRTPENAKNCFGINRSTWTPNGESICGTTAAGPTNDGRRKPEIMAPGCSLSSASGSAAGACTTASLTGTSMACPSLAGLSILVRQYYFDGYYPTGAAVPANAFNPSAALVKATLFNSAVDMSGVAGFPSNQEGWGRALADNALYFPGDARKLIAYDVRNNVGLSTGATVDYPVTVAAGQSLKVALVWSDPSAAVNANPAYVNNLDLEVIDPASTTYKGNVFTSGVSTSGGTADIRNNAEIVYLTAPTAGNWTVRVRATAVNSGTQGYAVVITGGVSSAPPPPPAPGPFNLASPSNGATNQSLTPTISWSASSNAASYGIVVSSNPLLVPALHSSSGIVGTSYNIPGGVLTAGNTYYWGVTATNVTGNTASTPTAFSFTTTPPPPPPGAFNLSTPSNGATNQSLTPSLTWSPSSNVVSYTVTVANDAGLTSVVDTASGIVGTNYVVTSGALNAGQTYYWGVTAVNGVGNTASTPAAFSFATTPPACVGDINGDGQRNTADLTIMLGSFGSSVPPNTLGDLDGNGLVNTNDLTTLLGVFGVPCP